MTSIAPSLTLGGDKPTPLRVRDLYARMLCTRIVDDYTWKLHTQGFLDFVASCRGHEAAQVGSAVCIEVGKDFTLPYYRDLGVVLTIGMTPHEVFRTYLQNHTSRTGRSSKEDAPFHHWGYHKHNTVTGPAPVATQLLHAAGIAFASKLRKAGVVTVAYCGDSATTEPDFLEGLRFAALHQLPVIFICEQAFIQQSSGQVQGPVPTSLSCLNSLPLPRGLTHQQVDGTDVVTVYQSMQAAMQDAREGHGPILLEMHVVRSLPHLHLNLHLPASQEAESRPSFIFAGPRTDCESDDTSDPLIRCQHYLQAHGMWDDHWADQLYTRLSTEIECAWYDVLHDVLQSS
jgi:2-oxoisovalerate dehydrogenase E1 component alpha subunit